MAAKYNELALKIGEQPTITVKVQAYARHGRAYWRAWLHDTSTGKRGKTLYAAATRDTVEAFVRGYVLGYREGKSQ